MLHIVIAVLGDLGTKNSVSGIHPSAHLDFVQALPKLFQFLWLCTSVNCKQTDHFPDGDKAVIDFTSLPSALQICFLQTSAEQI